MCLVKSGYLINVCGGDEWLMNECLFSTLHTMLWCYILLGHVETWKAWIQWHWNGAVIELQ